MSRTDTKDARRTAGEAGERAARQLAQRMGWRVIDHNVRWREGELDLIALDRRTLVIAEVKTLVSRSPDGSTAYSPFESIGRRKQNQIRLLARRWISDELPKGLAGLTGADRRDMHFDDLRFDAFAVTLDRGGAVLRVEHLADAF